MSLSTWSCADGKTLEWAVYRPGAITSRPQGHAAGADQLIWSFMSKTPLAPVPG